MFDDKCQELELLTSKLAEQRAKTHHFKAETKSKLIKQEREEKVNRGKKETVCCDTKDAISKY